MPPAAFSVASLGIALSFLTRLNLPARLMQGGQAAITPASIATSVIWYPVVGLLVGLMCVAPAYGLQVLALPWGHGGFFVQGGAVGPVGAIGFGEMAGAVRNIAGPVYWHFSWLSAWLYVLTGFVLTRGLHWDGLADISDAWGSGAQGSRFWEIVKDSRLGAFGAMGQLLAFSGLLIAAQGHISQQQWGPLVWACVVGRVATILLAAHSKPRDAQSLGAMASAGATMGRAYGWTAAIGVATALMWGLGSLVVLAVLVGGLVMFLAKLARAHQGCNGDFLGTVIVGAELCCLVALLL